ncbi:MAG: YbaN family protein [Rhodospirillales bacterium]|nr:YbaN family protein [Rhodospirillales bacterium]
MPTTAVMSAAWMRWALIGLGWLLIGIGIVGIFVPVLPTTVFLIAALWAFSRSSKKFQVWLWTHPTFGPPVRNWHLHQVIPIRGKVLAVIIMTLSFVYVAIWIAEDWRLPTAIGAVMLPAALYIVTRRSTPPDT